MNEEDSPRLERKVSEVSMLAANVLLHGEVRPILLCFDDSHLYPPRTSFPQQLRHSSGPFMIIML
ncbi:hypothetical protein DC345_20030 [Paenibacillus taichungensis]|uniref:Uncharacterized protein n=1 Tax=Paenibacillus taichungensis TaxID=484184 RepID=A0A329QK49_9BACL|nr:hypothetical protein DC345_20030 [Paenibacillus taichungensis]